MFRDYFSLALKNLLLRRLRSLLTIIGIVIGIVSVVALISVGKGMQNAINEEFKTVGQDRIIIKPGGGAFAGSMPVTSEFSTDKLYEHDVNIIKDVKGIDKATGVLIETGGVEYNEKIKYISVFGVPTDLESTNFISAINFFLVDEGRQFSPSDKYKAIIGYDVARSLFGKRIGTDIKLKIQGAEFKVVGVQKKSGSPVHDRMVRIPIELARGLFDKENDEVSTIFSNVEKGCSPEEIALGIKKSLRKDHDVEEGEEDFTVTTSSQLISGFNNILNIVQIVLIGIAAISLFVGGIGIMNTMYTSVLQRRKEIGIMKSVGAKNYQILVIFLIESGLLGMVGGVVGVILGILIGKGVEYGAMAVGLDILKAYVSAPLVICVLLFSFFVGSLSGLLPARKAARLQVVDSLRGV